jgi:uncharacterized secreted protein with C-terminal beta-propeller domain
MKRRRLMGRSPKKRSRLFFESLEPRVVMDGAAGEVLVDEPPSLQHFSSAAELQEFLVTKAVDQWKDLFGKDTQSYYPYVFHTRLMADHMSFAVNDASASFVGPLTSEVYSRTNVQVAGVDEADLLKTDGKYLYIARDRRLLIVDVQDPAAMQIVSSLDLTRPASELYLDGDNLTVISRHRFDSWGAIVSYERSINSRSSFQIDVFDIANRSDPKKQATFEIDGNLVQSRAIGGHVVLVSQNDATLPALEMHCDEESEGESKLRKTTEPVRFDWDWPIQDCVYETQEEYLARVSDKLLDLVLPHYSTGGSDETSVLLTLPESVAAASNFFPQLHSVTVLDVGAEIPTILDSAGVLSSYATHLYATEDNVYLTTGAWSNSGEKTNIIQFSLGENQESVSASAIGSVDGHLLNQFAMDEHEGYLRVATTSGWGGTATNRVFVLEEVDGQLVVTGKITDITPGETIMAARFMGDVAFLVTFLQIDPLIALDLSDPNHPVIDGELEIPGFSHYLHPIGGDYLIGIGRDADPQTGWTASPQVSLFDVRDLTQPKLLDRHYIPGGDQSSSRAFFDHHAISYFEGSGILALPFTLPEGGVFDERQAASQLMRAFDLSGLKRLAAHLPDDLSVSDAFEKSLQYLPDAWREILLGEFSSLEDFKTLIAELPDEVTLRHALTTIRQFLIDSADELAGDLPTLDELKEAVKNLPTEVTNLIDRIRDRVPTFLRHIAGTIVATEGDSATHRRSGLWLFHIDPTAEDPIQHVGTVSHGGEVERSLLIGDALITVSQNTVRAHSLAHPDQRLGELYIGPRAISDYFKVDYDDPPTKLDVLANDKIKETGVIVSVTQSPDGSKVAISEDGKSVIYTPLEIKTSRQYFGGDDSFTYTVDTGNGITETATVHVQLSSERAGRRMAELAIKDLARRLGVPESEIQVLDVTTRIWNDSCLGVEQPDQACAEVLTPGFGVWLGNANRRYEYHTDTVSTVLFVERKEVPPLVADDEFRVLENSELNELNVLANDFRGINFIKAPQITEVTTPDQGGRVVITEGGYFLRYTPALDFRGVETFYYTVDGGGRTGKVTVSVAGDEHGDTTGPLIEVRLEITDADGNPVTEVELGEQFYVNVHVKDLRDAGMATGVFSTYVDLLFNTSLATVKGEIDITSDYENGVSGESDRSGVNELGGFAGSIKPLGAEERLLARVPLEALDLGSFSVVSDPADLLPQHAAGLYGNDNSVGSRRIKFGSAAVEIVNSYHNDVEGTDTNEDGTTSATDALPIINWLNERGASSLKQVRNVERALFAANADYKPQSYRIDTNRDGFCTHMDVLKVFNEVNRKASLRATGHAEGESGPLPLNPNGTLANLTTNLPGPNTAVSAADLGPLLVSSTTSGSGASDETEPGDDWLSCTEEVLNDLIEDSNGESTLDVLFAELGAP